MKRKTGGRGIAASRFCFTPAGSPPVRFPYRVMIDNE
jgi:hypothetical protein